MKQLSMHQKEQAIELLSHCFQENVNFHFLFGSKKRVQKQLNRFLHLFVTSAKEKNGVYLSDDEQGIAIIYPVSTEAMTKNPIKMKDALGLFPLFRIPKIIRFQKKIAPFQPKEDHLYFQFLGVGNKRSGMQTLMDLKDACFKLSEIMHLPIYAQTSNIRTKVFYERYGFTCYAAVNFPKSADCMYFLKRNDR